MPPLWLPKITEGSETRGLQRLQWNGISLSKIHRPMITTTYRLARTLTLPAILLDIAAILLIYFLPALSHLIGFPLYLIEPMRIAIILAMLHTRPANAYILALSLPAFSFAVSAHPHILKALLISVELLINVWLFLLLKKKFRNLAGAVLFSIIISKGVYYLLKAMLLSALLLPNGPLVSTPLWVQASTLLAFSLYAWVFSVMRRRNQSAQ